MTKTLVLVFSLLMCCAGSQAWAQDQAVAELLRRHTGAGTLAQGESELAARPQDAQTVAAINMICFARAVEKLGQNLHRYGLRPPRHGLIPILRLPVPENRNPEPLTYEKMRAVYAAFLADLGAIDTALQALPTGPVKLPLDLNGVRLDLNGDGRTVDEETLGAIVQVLTTGGMGRPRQAAVEPWEVAFDRADMLWLRGYTRLLSGFLEFALAYDWRDTYAATAHLFFAGAVNPSGSNNDPSPMLGQDAGQIADAIAFIHLARWPVAEPQRLLRARDHLKAVTTISRETWKEILAETDDDREWVPAPGQKNTAFPGMAVTQERLDAWLAALDEFDAALDGKKLIPHWRYRQGMDLNAFFTQPRPFDLVLWITGHAALPYLKDGPVIQQTTWAQWQRVFAGQFLTYAIWFN